jgi:hypothetical protein
MGYAQPGLGQADSDYGWYIAWQYANKHHSRPMFRGWFYTTHATAKLLAKRGFAGLDPMRTYAVEKAPFEWDKPKDNAYRWRALREGPTAPAWQQKPPPPTKFVAWVYTDGDAVEYLNFALAPTRGAECQSGAMTCYRFTSQVGTMVA